jgi:hypothetical protein
MYYRSINKKYGAPIYAVSEALHNTFFAIQYNMLYLAFNADIGRIK